MRLCTDETVKKQLQAMNCIKYKIGIFDRNKKNMSNEYCLDRNEKIMSNKYDLDYNNILNLIPWLKYNNVTGKDIFIGQAENIDRALILVDDLCSYQIQQMCKRGVSPACVIETSPDNFQVWVSLGMEPMPKAQRKIVATILAKEFGGDPASTAANHYGRLAGFTNRKPEHLTSKGYPFILCRKATGLHAEKSYAIRAWAEVQEKKIEKEMKNKKQVHTNVRKKNYNTGLDIDSTFNIYFEQWSKHIKNRNKSEDLSRGDFAVACRMLKEGFTKTEIVTAIINNSPNINERKANHIEDYAIRTVKAAANRI
jgi:hypothetical protein